jgi:hypothetical protein
LGPIPNPQSPIPNPQSPCILDNIFNRNLFINKKLITLDYLNIINIKKIFKMKEDFKHDLYTYVENEKDADALAWAWVNKEKVVKFPFKFPPLAPNEIRANVLYVGLCHSDIFHVRD